MAADIWPLEAHELTNEAVAAKNTQIKKRLITLSSPTGSQFNGHLVELQPGRISMHREMAFICS
jgi:hypothetical protein